MSIENVQVREVRGILNCRRNSGDKKYLCSARSDICRGLLRTTVGGRCLLSDFKEVGARSIAGDRERVKEVRLCVCFTVVVAVESPEEGLSDFAEELRSEAEISKGKLSSLIGERVII